MVTRRELIGRIAARTGDKDVEKMFENFSSDFNGEDFFRTNEKVLRAILPTVYGKMLEEYKKNGGDLYNTGNFLLAYAALEEKVVDGNDLSSVENISGLKVEYSWKGSCLNCMLYAEGLDGGKFTLGDVFAFVQDKPEYYNYFLPLLIARGDAHDWKKISDSVKAAGLTDTLRLSVFGNMLKTGNAGAFAFFIGEIENNRYDRFKAFGDAVAEMGDFQCTLTPARAMPVFKAVLRKNLREYLCGPFKENYYFHAAVRRIFPAEFPAYLRMVLNEGMPAARWALLCVLSAEEVNEKYAGDIFSAPFGREEFSFLSYKLKGKSVDRDILPDIFRRMLALYDGMEKVNYHYPVTEDISFARDVSKADFVRFLTDAACALGGREYFECLDARYEGFGEGAQVVYLERAGDKTSLDVRACAIRFLKTDKFEACNFYDRMKIALTYEEGVAVSDYLKSKRQSVKSRIVRAFLASPAKDRIREYLLSAKEEYKVSVGREMSGPEGNTVAENRSDRPESPEHFERSEGPGRACFSPDENGMVVPCPQEEIDRLLAAPPEKFGGKSITLERLEEFFETLEQFIREHKDFEYKPWIGEGLVTFGSHFSEISKHAFEYGLFCDYPLGEELKTLLLASLTEEETISLFLLLVFADEERQKYYSLAYGDLAAPSDFGKLFGFLAADEDGRQYAVRVLQGLELSVVHELFSKKTRMRLIELFSREELIAEQERLRHHYRGLSCNAYTFFGLADRKDAPPEGKNEDEDTEMLRACAYAVCVQNVNKTQQSPSVVLYAKLYEKGIISSAFLRHTLLTSSVWLGVLSRRQYPVYLGRPDHPYPRFRAFMLALIGEGLDAELARGTIATPYNKLVQQLNCFEGMQYFLRAVVAARGLTIVRSPSSYSREKDESLSKIMKYTVRGADDSYEKFAELVREYGITREELVRATLFNPSFIDYAERYLEFPRFKFAAYYFIAHLNESEPYDDDRLYEMRKETIREYSDIDYRDFKDGAFDYKWYKEMIESVPADRLKMIYDNAKYVTVGGLHKRAQRFFDAMNGKISKTECVERIKASRNKDFCLIYSLIPIENKVDLRERYVFLQDFLKESKKYGAQRRMSERRTVDIALENLARAAGYSDVNLFMFELEADDPHDIYKTFAVDEIEITPVLLENGGKVVLTVYKNGKKLSAVPAKYAGNATVVWLKEEVKLLNEKFRRIARAFEQAMCDKTAFSAESIVHMSREKTIASVLERLVFLLGGKPAVFRDGAFFDPDGRPADGGMHAVYVAHPVELRKADALSAAIEYIVRNNVRQPFKQVLREFYLKSEQELSQDSVLRFKGFNVDIKKCIAALKGKGWGVSEDIGLRKVYYASDTVAALFRKFDELYVYDFENTDRELHSIFFLGRHSEEVLPLKAVDDITFSETLRDVDLMITVSANGIYDYELAMSSVEIRQAILRSVVSVLGLTNVSFLKDNISIKGTYGTYLVNIRTGLVFKEGKGNLLLDTVYSTPKPLLLDFIDEDPMTADIISKAVILSEDAAVKDPYILREIKD